MTAAMVVAILLMVVPTAALADPPDESGAVERVPTFSDPIFWDGELLVLIGPPFEHGCFGEGFSTPTTTMVTTRDGATITSFTYRDRVDVYDIAGYDDWVDWLIGVACAAVWAGEAPPEPLAHGEGTVMHNMRVDADGDVRGDETLRLVAPNLVTSDGGRAHVNARISCEPWQADCGPTDFINYRD